MHPAASHAAAKFFVMEPPALKSASCTPSKLRATRQLIAQPRTHPPPHASSPSKSTFFPADLMQEDNVIYNDLEFGSFISHRRQPSAAMIACDAAHRAAPCSHGAPLRSQHLDATVWEIVLREDLR